MKVKEFRSKITRLIPIHVYSEREDFSNLKFIETILSNNNKYDEFELIDSPLDSKYGTITIEIKEV